MATQITTPIGEILPLVDREALARKVACAFAKLAEHKDDIQRLWHEFENLQDGETIMSCTTKKDFCEKILGRSYRTIRYLLTGRESKAHEQSSRIQTMEQHEAEDVVTENKGSMTESATEPTAKKTISNTAAYDRAMTTWHATRFLKQFTGAELVRERDRLFEDIQRG